MRYLMSKSFELLRFEIDLHVGCMLAKVFQYLIIWGSDTIMYLVDLIELIVSWEQWTERKYLVHDTTHSPDVHFVTVVAIGEQAFRCSIPPGRDVLCQWLILV